MWEVSPAALVKFGCIFVTTLVKYTNTTEFISIFISFLFETDPTGGNRGNREGF